VEGAQLQPSDGATDALYAICLNLALMDRGGAALALAWVYAALRIAHSLVQATTNGVRHRFLLFARGVR
jgi:hypothetical protein